MCDACFPLNDNEFDLGCDWLILSNRLQGWKNNVFERFFVALDRVNCCTDGIPTKMNIKWQIKDRLPAVAEPSILCFKQHYCLLNNLKKESCQMNVTPDTWWLSYDKWQHVIVGWNYLHDDKPLYYLFNPAHTALFAFWSWECPSLSIFLFVWPL